MILILILIQLAAAVLLLAPPTNAQQDLQCSAAQDDKEGQVKCILQRVEKETLKFRDEIERAYGLRCNEETLARCRSSNFNDCKSIFPNRQCMKDVLDCGGDCGALLDKTTSSVYIPSAEGDYTETACYTLLAEEYMRTKYEEDEDFWDTYEVKPPWTYFGARNGLFRRLPAIARDKCGSYDFDPRVRPWFVAASSGPKDVVIVLDVSGSMMNSPGRMDLAKEAAIKVVNTLTISDRVAVIVFSETANATQLVADSIILTDKDTTLIKATDENKKLLEEAINQISSDLGETNFYAGFQKAFEALNNTDEEDPERISGCNAAILFLTDGKSNVGPDTDEVLDLINDSIQQLAIDTKIFTFSLGNDADQNVTKKIACSTNGIWTHIEDLNGDLVGAMASYYKLYALGLGYNAEFTAWVELYEFVSCECCVRCLSCTCIILFLNALHFTQLKRWAQQTVHPSLIDLLILPYS
jgi:Mg-chelatase subunit ChlD